MSGSSGVVGTLSGSLENVTFDGAISNDNTSINYVGGLVLEVAGNAVIRNCINYANINAIANTGGIVGSVYEKSVSAQAVFTTNFQMDNCYNISADSAWYLTDNGNSSMSNCFSLASSSLPTLQLKTTYTNSGWTFGTYGTAIDGWVWITADMSVGGETDAYSLPRLCYEVLEDVSEICCQDYCKINACANCGTTTDALCTECGECNSCSPACSICETLCTTCCEYKGIHPGAGWTCACASCDEEVEYADTLCSTCEGDYVFCQDCGICSYHGYDYCNVTYHEGYQKFCEDCCGLHNV